MDQQILSNTCVRKRECRRKASLPGYQTSLLYLCLSGRVDWEVVLTVEKKTNSDTLTLVGLLGVNESGKSDKMIGGGIPRRVTQGQFQKSKIAQQEKSKYTTHFRVNNLQSGKTRRSQEII